MVPTQEIFEILSKSVVKIENLEHEEVPFTDIEIKFDKQRFSKYPSYNLYVDGVPYKGKLRGCRVWWKCRCGKINSSILKKFLGKRELNCQHCIQDRKFGGKSANAFDNPKRGLKIPKQEKSFENEPMSFQNEYWKTHFTEEEFFKSLPYFTSINDIKLTDEIKSSIKFYPTMPCNNQFKYTSKVEIDGKLQTFWGIKYRCTICGEEAKSHIENFKKYDLENLVCTHCKLTNHRFVIKNYKDTELTYQSSIEEQFIEKCLNSNIEIENGLRIPYFHNNKDKTYYTDFYLPKYKRIIELKSDNIWFKHDTANGRIEAKNKAAEKYAEENNLKFDFIFDNEIDNYIQSLIQTKEIV